MIHLFLAGKPIGRSEPETQIRGKRVHHYPTTATSAGMVAWRAVWLEAGSPVIPKGHAMRVALYVIVERPASHLKKNGELAAGARRHPYKPDVSNVLKLAEDALQKHAFHDDVDVVDVSAQKRYAYGDEQPGAHLWIEDLEPAGSVDLADELVFGEAA